MSWTTPFSFLSKTSKQFWSITANRTTALPPFSHHISILHTFSSACSSSAFQCKNAAPICFNLFSRLKAVFEAINGIIIKTLRSET